MLSRVLSSIPLSHAYPTSNGALALELYYRNSIAQQNHTNIITHTPLYIPTINQRINESTNQRINESNKSMNPINPINQQLTSADTAVCTRY